ncbi:hypothetical protein C7Y47_00305 [Lysinibacillus sphaericus]|uniref:Uncharacterized protein n=1 Tax=Lysinibacillus sphaericus TaxID=1421 RepID=A0A544V0A5_LYSSH|nr:hypothetical protein [Lysinibacillus sp. SDF0037]TQR39525.1 hypothetical protein C7Y47_00305 [Lysinibacillus sp. SDF0037]
MSCLNDALSKKVDFSFCIEKEISRHYLYNVAEKIIKTAIDDESKHNLVIENLTFLFTKIHGQQISDMQKYSIYKKILIEFNDVIETSFTEKLIKELVIGNKLLHLLNKKLEQYQLNKKVECTHLNFIILGIKHNYSTFLIEIDPKLIDLINTNHADESIISSRNKNVSSQNNTTSENISSPRDKSISQRNNRENIWIDNKKVWNRSDDD